MKNEPAVFQIMAFGFTSINIKHNLKHNNYHNKIQIFKTIYCKNFFKKDVYCTMCKFLFQKYIQWVYSGEVGAHIRCVCVY